jgi:uncharacterized protein (DUF433 family)
MEPVLVQHIERNAGVCGGKPCIAGTRIRVQDVYVWHEVQKQSVDAILADFPQLSRADVYAALTFFWDHRDDILKDMADADALVETMKARSPSPLQQKLASRDATNHSLPSG